MKSPVPSTVRSETPPGSRPHAAVLAATIAAALSLTPSETRANAETTEVWTEVGVRVVPLRRLRLTFSQSARFSTLYGLRRVIPEVEADYRIIGPLRLGVGYRYLWRTNSFDEVEEGHLVHGDLMAQFRVFRRFDVELRSRVQWRTVGQVKSGYTYDDTRDMWRNRVNLEWGFARPLTANAFVEHWTRFDDAVRHDRFRVGAALSVEVSNWRFQLFYQRDMPDFIDSPNVNMVGVNARLELDLVHR